jgi:hypothetical protein
VHPVKLPGHRPGLLGAPPRQLRRAAPLSSAASQRCLKKFTFLPGHRPGHPVPFRDKFRATSATCSLLLASCNLGGPGYVSVAARCRRPAGSGRRRWGNRHLPLAHLHELAMLAVADRAMNTGRSGLDKYNSMRYNLDCPGTCYHNIRRRLNEPTGSLERRVV